MSYLKNITFLNPDFFWLFLIIPIILYFFYKKEKAGINFINLADIKKIFKTNNYKFYLKIILLLLILINFILIIANPNTTNTSQKIKKNGIDIVIALDISGSMMAEDLKPNRIGSAKNVINTFIDNLKTDRLGLVVFAGKPFTSIPLTFDYNILKENIKSLSVENINQQKRGLSGTAVGDSILMAKTLFPPPFFPPLQEGEKSLPARGDLEGDREKVIILLTDGDANVGVDPILAGLSAKKNNIKIYTIGIGSKKGGYINYKIGNFKQKQLMPPLKEKPLIQIANDTGGFFFRATDNNTFKDIFKELSKLEKNDIEIEVKKQYAPYYKIFIYSLIFLIIIFGVLTISGIETRNRN